MYFTYIVYWIFKPVDRCVSMETSHSKKDFADGSRNEVIHHMILSLNPLLRNHWITVHLFHQLWFPNGELSDDITQ